MAAQVLIVSDGTVTDPVRLLEAVSRGGAAAAVEREPAHALARVRRSPRSVVLDAAMPGAEEFVATLRSDRETANCAVLAVVPRPSDGAFAEALSWGADEVLPVDHLDALTRMVRAIDAHDPVERPEATRGVVLVVAPAASDRLARARPLRNTGYEVAFAGDAAELDAELARRPAACVVIDAALFQADDRALAHFVAAHGAPVVVVVAGPDVEARAADLQGVGRARVIGRDDPPDSVLFAVNELLRAAPVDARASERVQHTTVAAFRAEGDDRWMHGVTYNLSAEGLYVRTLAPPAVGRDVWIELRPPRSSALVHLDARVVWTRPFGRSTAATAPPGFGCYITGGSERSLARWREGHARVVHGRAPAATRAVPPAAEREAPRPRSLVPDASTR